MKKKILILIPLILCLILVIIGVISLNNRNPDKRMISRYEPFSKNNLLKNIDVSFKIKENLPKIDAASAFYPLGANIVQNVYDKEAYEKGDVELVSTNQAFEDVINKNVDLAIVTDPSDDQKELIKYADTEIVFVPLYKEPLLILVNEKNPIENIELDEIKKAYIFDDEEWNTYQLEKNNGSQTCFESIVKANVIEKNHYEIRTMPKIVDKIAGDKKAIRICF